MGLEQYKEIEVKMYFDSLNKLKKLHKHFDNVDKFKMDEIIDKMYEINDYYDYLISYYELDKGFEDEIERKINELIIEMIYNSLRIENRGVDLEEYKKLRNVK